MNVAVIPARGGSRRIPRKNIKPFHGIPILGYSIQAARLSGLFGSVYVTTDSPEIMEVAKRYGAGLVQRPEELARDDVGTQEVTAAALRALEFHQTEYACCIYATAPLLLPDDLRIGYAMLSDDTPYAYVPGLYYWGRADAFRYAVPLTKGYEVPFPVSRYIDINTPEDWARAERMYAELHGIPA